MKRQVIISYRWWRANKKPVKKAHEGALEETALDQVAEMIKQGFTSGNLTDNVRMSDADGEDGIEYQGWWEVITKNLKP